MNTTPSATVSLSLFVFLFFVLVTGVSWTITGSTFIALYGVIMSFLIMVATLKLPDFFANSRRLQASNQMVNCIFYLASFLRHTSNFELAIRFAAERLAAPLSLDMKKVLWDTQTNKYGNNRGVAG